VRKGGSSAGRKRGGGGEAAGPSRMDIDGEEEEEEGASAGGGGTDPRSAGDHEGPSSSLPSEEEVDADLATLDFTRLTQEHRGAQDAAAKEALEK
jgi:hypothetical protein